MARRGLNNVIRKKHVRHGQDTWKMTTRAFEKAVREAPLAQRRRTAFAV
jgi:hypothetical protein